MAVYKTKRQIAIDLMTEHQDKSMDYVLPLIAEQADLSLIQARGYYWSLVRNGQAPGTFITAREQRMLEAEKLKSRFTPGQTKYTETDGSGVTIKLRATTVAQAEAFLKLARMMPEFVNSNPVIELPPKRAA